MHNVYFWQRKPQFFAQNYKFIKILQTKANVKTKLVLQLTTSKHQLSLATK